MSTTSERIIVALEQFECDMIDGSEDQWRAEIAHDLQCVGLLYRHPRDRDNGIDAEVFTWAEFDFESMSD